MKIGRKKGFAKKIIIVAVAVLLVMPLGGCYFSGSPFPFGSSTTRGNGEMIDGSFSHDGAITSLVVSRIGAIVNINPEHSGELRYTIDENLEEYLEISYQNGILRIATRGNRSITSTTGITFDVGADALQEIIVEEGAANIQGRGTLVADAFALEINEGAASVELALDVRRLTVELTGAAEVTLSGSADELRINATGAVDVNTRNLIAQDATVSLEGLGSIGVYAAVTLNASIEGMGSITYWGDPELTSSATGLASIRRGS